MPRCLTTASSGANADDDRGRLEGGQEVACSGFLLPVPPARPPAAASPRGRLATRPSSTRRRESARCLLPTVKARAFLARRCGRDGFLDRATVDPRIHPVIHATGADSSPARSDEEDEFMRAHRATTPDTPNFLHYYEEGMSLSRYLEGTRRAGARRKSSAASRSIIFLVCFQRRTNRRTCGDTSRAQRLPPAARRSHWVRRRSRIPATGTRHGDPSTGSAIRPRQARSRPCAGDL